MMKLLILQQAEQQTLRDMGVFHPHPRVRIHAQAIVRLSRGTDLVANRERIPCPHEQHRGMETTLEQARPDGSL